MDEKAWAIAIATAAAGLGAFMYARSKSPSATKDSAAPARVVSSDPLSSCSNQKGTIDSPTTTSSATSTTAQSNHGARDVWEERRRRGITAASSHGSKGSDAEKPFSSSYYYAHNNSKAAGGYKDGLTMEDFTMNGPRLLSRGGKAVCAGNDPLDKAPENSAVVAFSSPEGSADKASEVNTTGSSTKPRRTLPISKYLWDDPGDSSGVASIRIEQLPGAATSNLQGLDWATARSWVIRIDTQLRDGGMTVSVETSKDVDYSLNISRFYGDVEAVEHISKAKRLIVRIKKKRGMFHRSNTKSWPHPHKKVD